MFDTCLVMSVPVRIPDLCSVFNCDFLFDSTSSALAKLTKTGASGGLLKHQHGEKKETPQERLKRIMNKQLNKQSMTLILHFDGIFVLIPLSWGWILILQKLYIL